MDQISDSLRSADSTRLIPLPRRASRACESCNARKVRCDISAARLRCSNCERDGQTCVPRQRRSRRPARHDRSSLARTGDQPRHVSEGVAGDPTTDLLPAASSPYRHGHMERTSFMGPESLRGQDGQEPDYANHIVHGNSVDRQICDLQSAYSLPSKAIQTALVENFLQHCYPWDPIIEWSQLSGPKASPLLLQAILLGGSRMSAVSSPSSHDFYLRAKTLFWTNQERSPLIKVVAASLLHWWNPHGPELVSTNTSTFWNRIAISLAIQMGLNRAERRVPDESLRRRIWWTLVARDHLISAAHGRPQAINLDYSDVPRPTIQDFPPGCTTAPVFVRYVDLAVIVGKLVNLSMLKAPVNSQISQIAPLLQKWAHSLPPNLQLSSTEGDSPKADTVRDNLVVRQLNVTYYAAVAMLYRARTSDESFPTTAVLAGSTIAGIFEELLARDQVRFLGPVYTFYLLVASIALLSCYKYENIWAAAQQDLDVIANAQEEMKKKWPSAIGSINSFSRMRAVTISTQLREPILPPQHLDSAQRKLAREVDERCCRLATAVPLVQNVMLHPEVLNLNNNQDLAVEHSCDSVDHAGERTLPAGSNSQPQAAVSSADSTVWSNDLYEHPWNLDDDIFGGYLFWDDLTDGFV